MRLRSSSTTLRRLETVSGTRRWRCSRRDRSRSRRGRVRRRAGLDDSADRTIRRTLSAMEAAGWLDHDDGSPWWYPGVKAAERFDVEYPHMADPETEE